MKTSFSPFSLLPGLKFPARRASKKLVGRVFVDETIYKELGISSVVEGFGEARFHLQPDHHFPFS